MFKDYLGDGVYVQYDGYHVILTTESGGGVPNNEIFIDPLVWKSLEKYVKELPERVKSVEQV